MARPSPVAYPEPIGPDAGTVRPVLLAATPPSDTTLRGKRALDLVLASLALLGVAPLWAVIAVAIRATSGPPVLFRQTRVGQQAQPFTMLKFRTMVVDADDRALREMNRRELLDVAAEAGTRDGAFKLQDDPNITPVGRLLRRLSLDELPQLLNVLRGEMSLVGPRPSLEWEVGLFSPRHRGRLAVPPGMTGLWQVSGRNRLSMTEMLELDLEYVERVSPHFDLEILARTLPALLRGDGAR
ncbi:MAG: sugar transferase [Dehalococcoidia bacterium]|nr:sugar transferase [Dehalococcoidia bacterium]